MVSLIFALTLVADTGGRLPNKQELMLLENLRTGNLVALRASIPKPIRMHTVWDVDSNIGEKAFRGRLPDVDPCFVGYTQIQSETLNLRSKSKRTKANLKELGSLLIKNNDQPSEGFAERRVFYNHSGNREWLARLVNSHFAFYFDIRTRLDKPVQIKRIAFDDVFATWTYGDPTRPKGPAK